MLGVKDIQQSFGPFVTTESNHTLIPSQFHRGTNIVGSSSAPCCTAQPASVGRTHAQCTAAALADPAEFYNNFGPSTSRSSAVLYLHFFITFSAQLPFSVVLAAQTLHWFGYLAPNIVATLKYLPFASSEYRSFRQSLLERVISEDTHIWRQALQSWKQSLLQTVTPSNSHLPNHNRLLR